MARVTTRHSVLRIDLGAGTAVRRPDTVTAEEPLEIRTGPAGGPKRALAVTMRTPGHDIELALGFLLTEGVIRTADDVRTAQLCAGDQEPNTYNVVDVTVADHVRPRCRSDSKLLHDEFVRCVRKGEHRRGADPIDLPDGRRRHDRAGQRLDLHARSPPARAAHVRDNGRPSRGRVVPARW